MKAAALGSCIRSLRNENGLTQRALAERLHVTDKAVSKWERGLSVPDIALFPALAEELSVTVADLLQECADEGASSRLARFYSGSTDIRTPLHIILGCADLMEKHLSDPSLLSRYLDGIRVSGRYLLSVLDHVQNPADLPRLLDSGSALSESSSEPFGFSGKRFLVVDDIALNREIAGEILKASGAKVEYAGDGQACLDRVLGSPAGHFDLILMDLLMPGMDGLEATRRLRRAGISVPVVAVTANVRPKDRKGALEAGMDAFIEKPVSVEKLLDSIRACLSPSGSL